MKYYLSLCCIIKDEKYLEQFIIYHHIVGVEHFYIYDNNSEIPIRHRLNSFYYNKICTIIDYPGSCKQIPAYKDCINRFKNETKWLIIVDGDEYILPKKNHWSIRDFLNEYEDVQAIGINWIMFGSSFHKNIQDGFLIDKYRYCEYKQDKHIKTICQPLYVVDITNPHYVVVQDSNKYIDSKRNIINGPFNENYTTDIIQINHYSIKSEEDLIKKYNRGNADSDMRISLLENHHELFNNITDNYLPDKYLNTILKTYLMTCSNAEIYKALNLDLHFSTLEEYNNHLFKYAILQNRPHHITDKFPKFNRDIYRKNYNDLLNLNDLQIELHYINTGFFENRISDILIEDNIK